MLVAETAVVMPLATPPWSCETWLTSMLPVAAYVSSSAPPLSVLRSQEVGDDALCSPVGCRRKSFGGGLLSSLFMTFYGRPIHQAVATSSGLGILISIPGALGYIYAGWPRAAEYPDVAALQPPLALGYISLIGLAAFDNLVRLLRVSNHTDSPRCDSAFAANGFGQRKLGQIGVGHSRIADGNTA